MRKKRYILILIFTFLVFTLSLIYLVLYKDRVYASPIDEEYKIAYDMPDAIIYFGVSEVQRKLKEAREEGRGQHSQDLLSSHIDTLTQDLNLIRTMSYKPTLSLYEKPDSINPKILKYRLWKEEQIFIENNHEYELALTWISLELIDEGKFEIYNKKLNRNEEYIKVNKYDNGLSWHSEYQFPDGKCFLNVMTGIR